MLECVAPEGSLRLFSSSPITSFRLASSRNEPLTGTYVFIHDGQTRSGAFEGVHNTGYGVAVLGKLRQENLVLMVQINSQPASARFYDATDNVVGGFNQCTGAAVAK